MYVKQQLGCHGISEDNYLVDLEGCKICNATKIIFSDEDQCIFMDEYKKIIRNKQTINIFDDTIIDTPNIPNFDSFHNIGDFYHHVIGLSDGIIYDMKCDMEVLHRNKKVMKVILRYIMYEDHSIEYIVGGLASFTGVTRSDEIGKFSRIPIYMFEKYIFYRTKIRAGNRVIQIPEVIDRVTSFNTDIFILTMSGNLFMIRNDHMSKLASGIIELIGAYSLASDGSLFHIDIKIASKIKKIYQLIEGDHNSISIVDNIGKIFKVNGITLISTNLIFYTGINRLNPSIGHHDVTFVYHYSLLE